MVGIFFLSTIVLVCAVIHLPVKDDLIESSAKCITTIADTYFTETISIFTTIDIVRDNPVLDKVIQSTKHDKKYFNFTTFKVNFWDDQKKYSIIVGRDINDFMYHKQLDNLALWNARSKYIFYTYTSNEPMLQKFVESIWNYYLINAIIIMPSSQKNNSLNIFSYFPYEDNCGKYIKPILLNTCSNGIIKSNINLFPNKVPLNLQGCPVHIRVLIWSPSVLPPEDGQITNETSLNITQGTEVQMMKAISSIANFTIKFSSSKVPHDWGLATVDGNVTGTIKVLREKEADIGMGSFGPTMERRMYCDHSVCHMQDVLTWCVPKACKAPKWKNLLEPFTLAAWIAMVMSYVFVSFIVWLFCNCPLGDESSYRQINNSFIYMFSAFLGISTFETPTKISSRILYIFWLFFGIQFIVAYQAQLIGVVLKPIYEPQISTIEEVLNSGMDFQILHTHRRFYSNTEDWNVAKIIKEWTSCHDSDACLKRVALSGNLALCTLKAHAEFEALQYRDSDGQPLIYCIDYMSFTSEMYMTKGFPLKDRIDKLIYRIRDSGLIFKWKKDLQWFWMYKHRHTTKLTQGEEVLTTAHMEGAFAVLIIGLNIALITFVVELLSSKYFTEK